MDGGGAVKGPGLAPTAGREQQWESGVPSNAPRAVRDMEEEVQRIIQADAAREAEDQRYARMNEARCCA